MIDYFKENLWQIWAIVALLCLILELTSGDFFITCLAVGALGAIVTAACGGSFVVQMVVFAVVSVLSIFFLRPALVKRVHRGGEQRKSNTEALIGREVTVVEAIAAGGYGYVSVDGDQWRARSADGSAIDAGKAVRVVAVKSIVVTVEKI